TEALPSFAVSSLRLNGRFPAMSGTLLAAGLVFFLRGRLEAQRGGAVAHWWRRARGPALWLLILGVAVAAPVSLGAIPRWTGLLLILGVLPLGRGRPPPATVRRGPALAAARTIGSALLALLALGVSLVAGEFTLRAVFDDEPWTRVARRLPNPA